MILQLAEKSDHSNVVDIGCGPGYATKEIAARATRVIGIDISGESIKCAVDRHGSIQNVKFVHSSVEAFADTEPASSYTLAIGNMALMTVVHLDRALQALSKLLKPGADFVFTICHPWFWPSYWRYALEPWFQYGVEIPTEVPALDHFVGLLWLGGIDGTRRWRDCPGLREVRYPADSDIGDSDWCVSTLISAQSARPCSRPGSAP